MGKKDTYSIFEFCSASHVYVSVGVFVRLCDHELKLRSREPQVCVVHHGSQLLWSKIPLLESNYRDMRQQAVGGLTKKEAPKSGYAKKHKQLPRKNYQSDRAGCWSDDSDFYEGYRSMIF